MTPELLTLTMTSYHTSLQVRSQSPQSVYDWDIPKQICLLHLLT